MASHELLLLFFFIVFVMSFFSLSLILRDHQDLKVHQDLEEKKATLDPGSVSVSTLFFQLGDLLLAEIRL